MVSPEWHSTPDQGDDVAGLVDVDVLTVVWRASHDERPRLC
jgi:hypothetical protein